MIENMLDPRNTNSVELLDHVYKSFTYQDKKNKNNSVDDIIRKYFATQEEDSLLMKDYLKSMTEPMIAQKEEE
jgi:inorganic pyrophosphatase/exopolyphosphatase